MSEQHQVKRLAIFHKVKESNTVIKKDLVIYKALLQAQQDNNNDGKKLIPIAKVIFAPILVPTNVVTIKDNNNNLDNEQAAYINTFINSNH